MCVENFQSGFILSLQLERWCLLVTRLESLSKLVNSGSCSADATAAGPSQRNTNTVQDKRKKQHLSGINLIGLFWTWQNRLSIFYIPPLKLFVLLLSPEWICLHWSAEWESCSTWALNHLSPWVLWIIAVAARLDGVNCSRFEAVELSVYQLLAHQQLLIENNLPCLIFFLVGRPQGNESLMFTCNVLTAPVGRVTCEWFYYSSKLEVIFGSREDRKMFKKNI